MHNAGVIFYAAIRGFTANPRARSFARRVSARDRLYQSDVGVNHKSKQRFFRVSRLRRVSDVKVTGRCAVFFYGRVPTGRSPRNLRRVSAVRTCLIPKLCQFRYCSSVHVSIETPMTVGSKSTGRSTVDIICMVEYNFEIHGPSGARNKIRNCYHRS